MEADLEQPRPLDEEWYPRFKESSSIDIPALLEGDRSYRDDQKRRFFSGEFENPTLDYPEIDLEDLKEREEKLLKLKTDILERELNEVVRQTYRWRINEQLAKTRMIMAAKNGEIRRFKRYSEFIYGKPSVDIFTFTINVLKARTEGALDSKNPDLCQAAQKLRDLLPELPEVEIATLPDQETYNLAKEATLGEFVDLISLLPRDRKLFKSEEIRRVFALALEKVKAEGWRTIMTATSKTGISVFQQEKEVKVPETRELLYERFARLIVHELTHVKRGVKGERSRLRLLGLGLDRYIKGEEGIAVMREQVIRKKFEDFAGFQSHFAVSLAVGLDGTPRDFRDVYEFLKAFFIFNKLDHGKNLEQSKREAKEAAWKRCIKTFRGTDCSSPGSCFTKDIVNREGNIDVWEVVKKNPEEMRRFNVGKYDPANERHIWILEQLGITEKDLVELEK